MLEAEWVQSTEFVTPESGLARTLYPDPRTDPTASFTSAMKSLMPAASVMHFAETTAYEGEGGGGGKANVGLLYTRSRQ